MNQRHIENPDYEQAFYILIGELPNYKMWVLPHIFPDGGDESNIGFVVKYLPNLSISAINRKENIGFNLWRSNIKEGLDPKGYQNEKSWLGQMRSSQRKFSLNYHPKEEIFLAQINLRKILLRNNIPFTENLNAPQATRIFLEFSGLRTILDEEEPIKKLEKDLNDLSDGRF